MSRHLTQLMRHGLVARESRGTSVYYRIADASVYQLWKRGATGVLPAATVAN